MRDAVVLSIVAAMALMALRRPWIGIMLWNWISIMNPHRQTFGIAYDAPLAALAAVVTLIGLLLTRDERHSPFKGAPVTVLAVFCVWMTMSWLLGLDVVGDYPQWNKVMKVNFMLFIGLAVLHSKKHVMALAWVAVGSLALLGAKGGLFTIATGGGYRVYGPPGTFVEDNNEFAVALIMTIPLLRFLQLQLTSRAGRMGMTLVMLLCAASALGSHSRGALLAMGAMVMLLWWRGKSRLWSGILMAVVAAALFAFMPENWFERMATIETYQDDKSAMSRISAWWCAWNLAFHYPLGVGFNAVRPELFALYSPYPDLVQAAHSIYFQVLGHHGFVGLLIYLVLWATTWNTASWLRKHGGAQPQTAWCADLGSMAQASIIGFAAGGAFLSLAYYDLPFIVMTLLVLSKQWVKSEAWKRESAEKPGRFRIPGLNPATAMVKTEPRGRQG